MVSLSRYLKVAASLTLTFIIVSCAPAAGRPAIPYLAEPQEVISAMAQQGPFIEPPAGYNFLSIETIGDGYITLRADATTGVQILSVLGGSSTPPLRVTVTTLEQGEITSVAISVLPRNAGDVYERIVRILDERFARAQESI